MTRQIEISNIRRGRRQSRQRWDALIQSAGFSRAIWLRRLAAAVLVGLAAILGLSPHGGSVAEDMVVVAAQDLSPGTVIEPSHVTVRGLPAHLAPDGAARSPTAVAGRTLAAPVRRGEPLTDVRLAGSELARAVSANPEAVSVPVRLADPGVATLLRPGALVDVVTIGARQSEPVVLAHGARVLTVVESGARAGGRTGTLVLIALDPVAATKVAATSISQELTVTIH